MEWSPSSYSGLASHRLDIIRMMRMRPHSAELRSRTLADERVDAGSGGESHLDSVCCCTCWKSTHTMNTMVSSTAHLIWAAARQSSIIVDDFGR